MIDVSRRFLDDRAPRTPNADAEHRRRADAHRRGVGGLFGDLKRPAPAGTHMLSGNPAITLKSDTPDPAAVEREQHLAGLLPAVRAKAGALTPRQLAALDFVARASKAAGGDPVDLLVGDVARAIKGDHHAAEVVLAELVDAGLLRRVRGVWGVERLLPTL